MNRQLPTWNLPKAAICLLLALLAAFPGSSPVVEAASTITRRASATANNGAGLARLTIPKPTGTQARDVLIGHVVIRSAEATITPPAGWQRIRGIKAGVGIRMVTYYKVASASEPASYTWRFSASRPATGAISGFVGVDTVDPIDVSSAKYNGATATASFPQVTTTAPGDMLLAFVGVAGNTTVTPPTGFAEDYDRHDSLSINGNAAEMSQAIKAAAGVSTVPSAIEDTLAAPNLTELVALRAAGAGDIIAAVVGDMECTTSTCQGVHTADLVANIHPNAFLPVGDLVFTGIYANYVNYYNPVWGGFRSISHPAIGNHDGPGAGYFDYWNGVGAQSGPAGTRGQGWYSFNIGSWHFVALNSNCVSDSMMVSCQPGSAEIAWLNADLAASTSLCTIAFMHHPYYTTGIRQFPELKTIFATLYQYHVELYLAGHTHYYQRFYPQDPNSNRDDALGVTEIVAGTGGGTLANVPNNPPYKNLAAQIAKTYGVLKLVLHTGSYSFKFLPAAGYTATDSGSGTCH